MLRLGAIGTVAAICLTAIPFLALQVHERLNALERANSDNTQWVLMQAEVEVLRLQTAVLAAREAATAARPAAGGTAAAAPPDPLADPLPAPLPDLLDEVRRWFNVVYSRSAMLQESPVYAPLLATPDYRSNHQRIRAYLDRTVPLIDSPDAALAATLDTVARDLPAIRAATRSMTLFALTDFAAQSDENRASIAWTLVTLAVVVTVLVVVAILAAIVLAWQSARSQAQAGELRRTGTRLATIFATSADAIVVTGPDGSIRACNPAAEKIFGRPAAQTLGRNAFDTLFAALPAGTRQALLMGGPDGPTTADAPPLRIELDARRADGSSFPAELSVARARTPPEGGEDLIVAFVRDISDRRAAERDLTRALDDALAGERARAEFLAVMSHEMRTPLSGLMGSLELLRQTGPSPAQQDLMQVMQASGDILLGHVNSVLDISRAEAGAIRPEAADFDLDRLVEEVVSNQAGLALAAGNRMRIVALSGAIGMVQGDRGRIGQILLNLVGNAVKFTRDGDITVETERLPTGADGVPLVEFRVADTGIGIATADLARIFDDFVTLDPSYGRSAGGTGLGLGIARRLAQAMGGEIGVESEPGEGSLFWLRLPLPPARPAAPPASGAEPPRPQPAAPPAPPVPGPHRSVLLVEDNLTNRFLLRRFLESGGHRVTEAADGLEGVAAAGRAAFDVILMDISMPRLDGVAATRAIRKGGGPSARARILALTAHALPEEQARFRAAGMESTLTKPITQADLLRAVAGPADDAAAPPPTAGAGMAAQAEPLIDAATLSEFMRHVGPVTSHRLIARLQDEAASMTTTLSGLDPETARADVIDLCHRLSGSCGTFGLRRLRALLIAAETAAKTDVPAHARALLVTLPDCWTQTRAALEEATRRLS